MPRQASLTSLPRAHTSCAPKLRARPALPINAEIGRLSRDTACLLIIIRCNLSCGIRILMSTLGNGAFRGSNSKITGERTGRDAALEDQAATCMFLHRQPSGYRDTAYTGISSSLSAVASQPCTHATLFIVPLALLCYAVGYRGCTWGHHSGPSRKHCNSYGSNGHVV